MHGGFNRSEPSCVTRHYLSQPVHSSARRVEEGTVGSPQTHARHATLSFLHAEDGDPWANCWCGVDQRAPCICRGSGGAWSLGRGPGVRPRQQPDRHVGRAAYAILDLQLAAGGGSVSRLPASPLPTQSGVDLSDLFARAEALEESAPDAAEDMYRQILVEEPTHAHAYLNLGFMLCEAGRRHSAVELYEDGVRFCPDDPLMHFNRAVAHEGTGDVERALESYEEAIRLQPYLLDAHRNAALLYADVGEKQKAIRHFSAFRRLQAGQALSPSDTPATR